jgi:hypothetical protein
MVASNHDHSQESLHEFPRVAGHIPWPNKASALEDYA